MREGWEIKTLGEVCDISAGQGAPQGEDNYCLDGTPFIKAGNLEALVNGEGEQSVQKVSKEVALSHRLVLHKKGSIVFAKSGMSCMKGYVYTLQQDCYVVSHLAILFPNSVSGPYLNYALHFFKPSNLAKDASFPSITLKDLALFPIPFPTSLQEQQRIVGILDQEFAKIDALKANAEKSLQAAKDLFIRVLDTTFDRIEPEEPLGHLVSIINGYAFKSEDFNKFNSVKSVKITNVGIGEFVETEDANLPQSYLDEKKEFAVHSGDIVFALTRTVIAGGLKVAIIPETYNNALLNQRVAAISVDNEIQRQYLFYFFQTTFVKNYILKSVNTLMQPNLSIKDLRAMPVKVSKSNQQTMPRIAEKYKRTTRRPSLSVMT